MGGESSRHHIVVDTNLIISGVIAPTGNPYALLQAWRRGEVALITSSEIIAEVERVLHKPRLRQRYGLTDEQIQGVVDELQSGAIQAVPLSSLPIQSRDPNDDMFLAVALGAAATFLVSGDNDLLSLKGAPELGELRIVTVPEFLDLLAETGDTPLD